MHLAHRMAEQHLHHQPGTYSGGLEETQIGLGCILPWYVLLHGLIDPRTNISVFMKLAILTKEETTDHECQEHFLWGGVCVRDLMLPKLLFEKLNKCRHATSHEDGEQGQAQGPTHSYSYTLLLMFHPWVCNLGSPLKFCTHCFLGGQALLEISYFLLTPLSLIVSNYFFYLCVGNRKKGRVNKGALRYCKGRTFLRWTKFDEISTLWLEQQLGRDIRSIHLPSMKFLSIFSFLLCKLTPVPPQWSAWTAISLPVVSLTNERWRGGS